MTAHWIVGAALLGLFASACNPSPHIDPPGSTGASGGTGGTGGSPTTTTGGGGSGGTTTTSTGGGGSTASGCDSNADCDYIKPLCDVPSGQCVECLVQSDCKDKTGTVCSFAACVCPDGLDFCTADGTGADRCVDTATSNTDCGTCGHACFDKCVAGACAEPWEPLSLVGAPSARWEAASVWTGSSMIVWGGQGADGVTNTGGIYDPMKGTWESLSTTNAPSPRRRPSAVWSGTKMIVFGGLGPGGEYLGDGGVFNLATKTWEQLQDVGLPSGRSEHTAVWAGAKMLLWGGFSPATGNLANGSSFDFANGWADLPDPAPFLTSRRNHSAVWTGTTMLVYGGFGFDAVSGLDDQALVDGAIYDAGLMSWSSIVVPDNLLPARYNHTSVWTGTEMIVFGGNGAGGGVLASAARFDPAVGWVVANAPASDARADHTALWFGNPVNLMVVWGGTGAGGALATGRTFNPNTAKWNAAGLPQAPSARSRHVAVAAAGSKMIIWGGKGPGGFLGDGAILDLTKVP